MKSRGSAKESKELLYIYIEGKLNSSRLCLVLFMSSEERYRTGLHASALLAVFALCFAAHYSLEVFFLGDTLTLILSNKFAKNPQIVCRIFFGFIRKSNNHHCVSKKSKTLRKTG